jgi:hypothetical protein
VVDIGIYFLVAFGGGRGGVELALGLNELPDVVLWDVVGAVGAAGDLVEQFAVGVLDFVSVQVVFCF